MFDQIAQFLLEVFANLFGAALLFRTWLIFVRVPFVHPLVQALLQLTDWLVLPLRRIISIWKNIDLAAILAAWLIALVYLLLKLALNGFDFTLFFPQILIVALLTLIKWLIKLCMWMVIVYVLMSWINPRAPAMMIVALLLAPVLNPIKRILPNLGGLDLSPFVLVVMAQIMLFIVYSLERSF